METTELDKCIALYIETKTPREIAERAGVTPERVIARAEEMKDEADALSIEASIHFLMRRLNAIAANAGMLTTRGMEALGLSFTEPFLGGQ